MATPSPPSPATPMSAAWLALLITKARDDVSEWMHAGPRPGQQHPCELAVGDLSSEERDALMRALVADGFAVQELVLVEADHALVFRVERAPAASLATPAAMAPSPLLPPALPAKLRALLVKARDDVVDWLYFGPRPGQQHPCELTVGDLSIEERDTLMCALVADGFAVREVMVANDDHALVFRVERAAVPPPATPAARLAAMQKLFDGWMATKPHTGQRFFRELAVGDLADDKRAALAVALTAAGFHVSDVEYDANPPCRVFHVTREVAAGDPAPPLSTNNNNNERVLAIVANANRQYTDWLVLNQCDLLDYSAWDADVTDLSDPERALLEQLLECHGFRVTRGTGITPNTFFLHRHPNDDYGSDDEEEDEEIEMGEMEEVA